MFDLVYVFKLNSYRYTILAMQKQTDLAIRIADSSFKCGTLFQNLLILDAIPIDIIIVYRTCAFPLKVPLIREFRELKKRNTLTARSFCPKYVLFLLNFRKSWLIDTTRS